MAAELPPLAQPLTDTPETSFTLSSAYYTDPGVFELEKEKIFYRSCNTLRRVKALHLRVIIS